MLDGWTDVFEVPGKRTTGTGAQKYAITGPGWSGTLPAGVKEYKSPTGMVWLLGRIYCTGTPEDYKAVHALQDQMSAVPLSAYGKPYTPAPGTVDPATDMKTAVRDQVEKLDGAAYFKLLAELLKTNPPTAERCADGGEAREDRHRARPGFRRRQARPGGSEGHRGGAEARAGEDRGLVQGKRRRRRFDARKRLAVHDENRARMARTTCSARSSPRSGWARIGRRMRSIRRPKPTPKASPTTARTST